MSLGKHKVYICGPMTGEPGLNWDEFDKWAKIMADELDYEVVNPAQLDRDEGMTPEGNGVPVDGSALPTFLRRDFQHLVTCDTLLLLERWRYSKGANAELAVARWLDMEVIAVKGEAIVSTQAMPNIGVCNETWTQFGTLVYQRQLARDRSVTK